MGNLYSRICPIKNAGWPLVSSAHAVFRHQPSPKGLEVRFLLIVLTNYSQQPHLSSGLALGCPKSVAKARSPGKVPRPGKQNCRPFLWGVPRGDMVGWTPMGYGRPSQKKKKLCDFWPKMTSFCTICRFCPQTPKISAFSIQKLPCRIRVPPKSGCFAAPWGNWKRGKKKHIAKGQSSCLPASGQKWTFRNNISTKFHAPTITKTYTEWLLEGVENDDTHVQCKRGYKWGHTLLKRGVCTPNGR